MKRDSSIPIRSRAPLKWPSWALTDEFKLWAGNVGLALVCAALIVLMRGHR